MSAIEQTAATLRQVFKTESPDFKRYFGNLLSLAQGGLVGAAAQPSTAKRALANLQAEVVDHEAERLKSAYMRRLGIAALWFAVPGALVAAVAQVIGTFPEYTTPHGLLSPEAVRSIGLIVAGCAMGVWLSFGVRKQTLTFQDLNVADRDYLAPTLRLIFTELLTISLTVLFTAGVAEVTLGTLSSATVYSNPLAGLVFGLLCGLGEQALPKQLVHQAERLSNST
jgi:hypothetical protein